MRRLTLIALFVSSLFAQERPSITAKPRQVQPGQSTTLTWNSSGQTAFLSGVGRVPTSGATVVTPNTSTEYTLVSESTQGIQFASTTVEVVGVRGSEAFP